MGDLQFVCFRDIGGNPVYCFVDHIRQIDKKSTTEEFIALKYKTKFIQSTSNGTVKKIVCKQFANVKEGDLLMIIQEIAGSEEKIYAKEDGKFWSIVSEGAKVTKNQLLFSIKSEL